MAAASASASRAQEEQRYAPPRRETTFLEALVQQLELVATSYGAVVILTFFALILVLLAWELLRPDTDYTAAQSFRAASKATPLRTYIHKHVTAEQFETEGAAATLKEMRLLRESLRTLPAAQQEAVISRLRNPERIRRFLAGGTDISELSALDKNSAENIRRTHLGYVNPIPTQEAQFELEENKARLREELKAKLAQRPRPGEAPPTPARPQRRVDTGLSVLELVLPTMASVIVLAVMLLQRHDWDFEGVDLAEQPIIRLPLTEWMGDWLFVTLATLVTSRLASILYRVPMLLFTPSELFSPVIAVTTPLFERLDASWDAVLRDGSLAQHMGGLVQLLRSFVEFTTFLFKLVTLVPVLYCRALAGFLAPSYTYFAYVGALAAVGLATLSMPFPREELHAVVWQAPLMTLGNELRAFSASTARIVQVYTSMASLESALLALYGHTCFVVAVMTAMVGFHASVMALGTGLAWLAVSAFIPSGVWIDTLFFVAVVLIPLVLGLRSTLVDLKDAVGAMLPLTAGLAMALAVNLLSDMQIVALANTVPVLLTYIAGPLLPAVVPASSVDGAIQRSYALGVKDVCLELPCGDLLLMPERVVGDVRLHLTKPPTECASLRHSCQMLAENSVGLSFLSHERIAMGTRLLTLLVLTACASWVVRKYKDYSVIAATVVAGYSLMNGLQWFLDLRALGAVWIAYTYQLHVAVDLSVLLGA